MGCPRGLLIPIFYPSHGAAAPSSSGSCRDREAQLARTEQEKGPGCGLYQHCLQTHSWDGRAGEQNQPPRSEKQLAMSYRINTARSAKTRYSLQKRAQAAAQAASIAKLFLHFHF